MVQQHSAQHSFKKEKEDEEQTTSCMCKILKEIYI
jgi:hypothetical protein